MSSVNIRFESCPKKNYNFENIKNYLDLKEKLVSQFLIEDFTAQNIYTDEVIDASYCFENNDIIIIKQFRTKTEETLSLAASHRNLDLKDSRNLKSRDDLDKFAKKSKNTMSIFKVYLAQTKRDLRLLLAKNEYSRKRANKDQIRKLEDDVKLFEKRKESIKRQKFWKISKRGRKTTSIDI